jgi:hypothetical protein
VLRTLATYIRLANNPSQLGVAISCDTNDDTMKDTTELQRILAPCGWNRIFYSPNKTKIEACNANMDEIDWDWDIVVLVSDDMVPQIRGYDDVIRNHMMAKFPDRNGILWFNDGCQEDKLNTLCVFGRTFYQNQGFMYHPEYKSLFCDTELTDKCRAEYKDICSYIPYCIIRHEHPGTGFAQNMDRLYEVNQRYWNEDMYTYIRRKTYTHDWSVLIPTIPGREESFRSLVGSIREKLQRIAPHLRVEFCVRFDNKEMSIGLKRQELLQGARGKYMSFVDDDDDITDAYIEDLAEMIRGNYQVMRLRGQIAQYTFTHSLENKLTSPMARGDVFLRPPNHLNPMLTDVAKLVSFRDSVRGEDLDWTIRLARSGFLSLEYHSDPDRIHYIYNMGVRRLDPETLRFQQNTSYETMLQMVWTPAGPALPTSQQQQSGPRIPILKLGPRGFVST